MKVERTGGYFHSFESDALPKIDWQEMFEKKLVFAPQNVSAALEEAKDLLVTLPGPNLQRRKILAPEWFGYWNKLMNEYRHESDNGLRPSGDKLVNFSDLSEFLDKKYFDEDRGMLFVAGAEGHKGHVHAAKYMARAIRVTIWGFEQDEYMQRKSRKAPFLSLPLRLSMWFYEPSLTHLTVIPRNINGLQDNDHYNRLFLESGATHFFVHEKDPYFEEKFARGEQDLDRTIHQDFPVLSTTEAVQQHIPEVSVEEISSYLVEKKLRVIPHLASESTTKRVKRLGPEVYQTEDRGRLSFRRHDSTFFKSNIVRDNSYIGYNETIFIE